MDTLRIAVISFPGNNCEVESMRAVRAAGMEPMYFRWNDDQKKLKDIDGYFIPGGFSYEDRGRSGMVAARDPLMEFIKSEAASGKPVIGICNGAQILVESGLIPNGEGLQMSLARNAIKTPHGMKPLPLLSEWIRITRSCERGRCVASSWDGIMHIPMAHGEGRYVTRDNDLLLELRKNDQIAFSYCDEKGTVSTDPDVTPNGASEGIAGICNPEGNVVALMPHPERASENGQMFFEAMKDWIVRAPKRPKAPKAPRKISAMTISVRKTANVEVFIDTLITNNEERTVEQAARRVEPDLKLKQWKYFSVPESLVQKLLSDLTVFNKNKERAFMRGKDGDFLRGTVLLRRDEPDASAGAFGKGSESGIAYAVEGISEQKICSNSDLLEVFYNPHASSLEKLSW